MRDKRKTQFSALLLAFFGAAALAPRVEAATYFPISDAELVKRSPVIVLAEVLGEESRADTIGGVDQIFTLVALKRIEVLKGSMPGEEFQIRLPGGQVGDVVSWMPGVPQFLPLQRAVLFLAPFIGNAEQYVLAELALSKFDVLEDSKHTFFAVRSMFQSGEERLLSPDGPEEAAPDEVRDFEAFLSALRVAGQGEPLPEVKRGRPHGALRLPVEAKRPAWVNLGGREPGDCSGRPCLFRWAWDTGRSPNGVVTISGTQSNLSDGSNGVAHVAHAIAAWTSIPATDVRYSGPSESGNVVVNLDVASHPNGAWSAPTDCIQSGVGGLGGPNDTRGPALTFKGDGNYFSPQAGTVWIRKNVCSRGMSVNYFRLAVLHELGHTLCLSHPDQGRSVHSLTTPADWEKAVMRGSVVAVGLPDTPQTDDIQAMQFYYGTQQPPGPTPCVADAYTLCLSNGRFRATTEWARTDGTSGFGRAVALTSDTGYFWFFDAANVELVVKALDGRAVNGNFWVFAGALSNVEYTLRVWDTQTGGVKQYVNPSGRLASFADTSAFAGASIGLGAEVAEGAASEGEISELTERTQEELYALLAAGKPAQAPLETAACAPGGTKLCLSQSRFEVRVDWSVPSTNQSGTGAAVRITGDTGYFWFFDSGNVELIIKVLDARVFSGKFWVFYGALSNVEYTITVTDTETGQVKTYFNPSGTLASVADTSAF